MGSNFFLVPLHVIEMLIRNNIEEILKNINEREYYDFSENEFVIHIGRNTNNLFIWNISPETLKMYCEQSLVDNETYTILHENGYEYEGENEDSRLCSYSYNTFMKYIENQTYNFGYVDKNIHFR